MGWSVYATICGYSSSVRNINNVDRFDWQLLTSDSKQRSTVITGLEEIANLIRRYAEIEHLYLALSSTDLATILKLLSSSCSAKCSNTKLEPHASSIVA